MVLVLIIEATETQQHPNIALHKPQPKQNVASHTDRVKEIEKM